MICLAARATKWLSCEAAMTVVIEEGLGFVAAAAAAAAAAIENWLGCVAATAAIEKGLGCVLVCGYW